MRVADFDFELPPENIALRPVTPREAAKLLLVQNGTFKCPSENRALNAGFTIALPNRQVAQLGDDTVYEARYMPLVAAWMPRPTTAPSSKNMLSPS